MDRTFLKPDIMKKWLQYFTAFLLAFTLAGCGMEQDTASGSPDNAPAYESVDGTEEGTGEDTEEASGQSSNGTSEDSGKGEAPPDPAGSDETTGEEEDLPEDGTYTSRDDVARYLYLYGRLPSNFITKKEAQALGWEGGSLEPYAPGKCIGGSYFGNYEGTLPEKKGRSYTECDIDTLGADKRGAKRIVFSNDGLIYYTEDHYETFELLYGEE